MTVNSDKSVTLTMKIDKRTKGAIRYAEERTADNPNPKNIYFSKEDAQAFGTPETLIFTIKAG